MSTTLVVPAPMLEAVGAFVGAEAIPLNVVADGQGDVTVEKSDERKPSTLYTLQAGGWITCPMAHEVASRLGISPGQIGKLLDHLDVKVRQCELGCFK